MNSPATKLTKEQELELISRFKQGDEAAFTELFNTYRDFVFHLSLKLSKGKKEDAEEHLQNTFLQVYKKIHSFRGNSRFSTWLYRVSFNVFLMSLRKDRSKLLVSLDEFVDSEETAKVEQTIAVHDRRLEMTVVRHKLARAVDNLAPGQRLIFELHDVQGYEHKEIAAMCGYSIGNSKSQLHKARKRVRHFLDGAIPNKPGRPVNARKENAPATKSRNVVIPPVVKVAAASAH